MVVIILFFPSIYFSSVLVSKQSRNSISPNDVEINKDLSSDEILSVFGDVRASAIQKSNPEGDARNSLTEVTSLNRFNIRNNATILKNLKIIITNKVFIFSALALATLFFIITAVQYWGSDYMAQALKVEDTDMILLSFSVVCVTSPTFGVILGGWTISLIGGYESKHSILLCLIYGIFAGLFAIPVTYANGLTGFTIYLWLVLFFGGAIVPAITGIIISTGPLHLRGLANSITSILSNLLGYLPAPFVYGLLNNIFEKTNDRLAFFCVMSYSFLGVIFLSFASYFRYKKFSDKETKTNISTKISLIDETKYPKKMSHAGSVISDNLQKIFGSYVNLNEMKEDTDESIEEEDRSQYQDDKNSIENNNINNIETVMTLDIQTINKNSSENMNNLNFTNKFNNLPNSEQTAQFNISSPNEIGTSLNRNLNEIDNDRFSFKNNSENLNTGKRSLSKDKFSSDSESYSDFDRDSDRNSVRADVEEIAQNYHGDKMGEEAKMVVNDELLNKKKEVADF
jgi:hypothetical protein